MPGVPDPSPEAPVERLQAVRRAIDHACSRAGRDPDSVRLVAASKAVPPDQIERVIDAGQLVFGENRVQEARAKWPALLAAYPDRKVHLIGPLQRNKVRDAVAMFDAIHSVDRRSLCIALAVECRDQGRWPELFVQVNTGSEPQKGGVAPEEADAFLASCWDDYELYVEGLMCVPPIADPPAPHFAVLAEIAARNRLRSLSMGMSTDFALAIEHGATHVRVGSAIFGARVRA